MTGLWVVAAIALFVVVIGLVFVVPTSGKPAVLMSRPTNPVPPMPACKPSVPERIRAFRLGAGDTLIVGMDENPSADQVSAIRAHMSESLPGLNVIVVGHDIATKAIFGRAPQSAIDESIARLDAHNLT